MISGLYYSRATRQATVELSHFPLSGVLRRLVVLGRVLVLLTLHPLYVGHVRVHAGQPATEKHGRDQEDGEQAIHDPGLLY